MTASTRQRGRRAARRLSLTAAQAEEARRLLRDDRRQLEAAQALLAECRRELREALDSPAPDSARVLELSLQERLLEQKERAVFVRLERSLATLLRPEQAVRLHALAPVALGDMLGRLGA
jgi:Spy/CpxP family protein refolding chaperone